MPTDTAELVAAAKGGDSKAFAQLVQATSAAAYTLAYRLTGNEEDARDVVQEAYLRAYKGLKRFRGDAQFSTWLYRITANCAKSHLSRRSSQRTEALDDEAPLVDERAETNPEHQADATLLRGRVDAALLELPPKLRAVVVLRDIYDLPHDAIAEELGITEAAAKVRLHRARRRLREQLFPVRGEEQAHAV
ncbi:MAG: RNA polymerase sigma factor [Acidimicrobiales bacterium]